LLAVAVVLGAEVDTLGAGLTVVLAFV
jgi:hypothetical protein